MESRTFTNKKQMRCKPMLTCAILIFEIASKAYTRTQDFDGPIGSTAKKMANFSTRIFPFYRLFQHYLLAILSFSDDCILSFEKLIQTVFPPSTKLFDKVDNYAHATENLPAKFDAALDKLPMIIHRVPFLDRALVCTISWLKFFVSILTRFGSKTSTEKEIVVDTCGNYHTNQKEPKSIDKSIFTTNHSSPSRLSISSNYETKHANANAKELVLRIVPSNGEMNVTTVPIISDITRLSYKEILERGTKENNGKKDSNNVKDSFEVRKANTKPEDHSEANENENSIGNGNGDPILELFAASWHMKPPKGVKKGSILHSASYT